MIRKNNFNKKNLKAYFISYAYKLMRITLGFQVSLFEKKIFLTFIEH